VIGERELIGEFEGIRAFGAIGDLGR